MSIHVLKEYVDLIFKTLAKNQLENAAWGPFGSRRLAIHKHKVRSESLASEATARGNPNRAQAESSQAYHLVTAKL